MRIMGKYCAFIIFLLSFSGYSQNKREVDSLTALIPKADQPTLFKIYNRLTWIYMSTDLDLALKYGQLNLKSAEILQNEKSKPTEDMAIAHSNLGLVYQYRNEHTKSLDHLFKSYNFADSIGDKKKMSACLLNIGNTYNYQKNHKESMRFYKEAIALKKEINDEKGMVNPLINIAGAYYYLKEQELSIQYFEEAYKYAEKFNDTKSKYIIEGNLGILYRHKKEYDKALKYQHAALNYKRSKNDNLGVVQALQNISIVYQSMDSLQQAINCLEEALALAKKGKFKDAIADLHHNLSGVYAQKGEYEKAYLLGRDAKVYYDSLSSENSSKSIAEMQTKFDLANKQRELELTQKESRLKALESEKKSGEIGLLLSEKKLSVLEAESRNKEITLLQNTNKLKQKEAEARKRKIELLNKEKQVQNAEIERQNVLKISFAVGFSLMILLAVFIYRGLLQNKKAKKIIELQKHEVEKQREIVVEKNKEITDSINYAKRLQQAILATREEIQSFLPQSFLLYKPKDIVAGDFYFFETSENYIFYAAADCTGHGVPGAMVSIVCSNALSRCVKEFDLNDPGEILTKTRDLILETFKKSGQDVKDGMDISFITINRKDNTIRWSGANNALWLITTSAPDEITEITPDKQPIGKTENPKPFTTHILDKKVKSLYLFTDGYADQFGGEKGKKLKDANLKKIILKSKEYSPEEQQVYLDREFEKWRGNLEQLDDVCVIGVSI